MGSSDVCGARERPHRHAVGPINVTSEVKLQKLANYLRQGALLASKFDWYSSTHNYTAGVLKLYRPGVTTEHCNARATATIDRIA